MSYRTIIIFTDEQKAELRKAARRQDRSINWLVRDAVNKMLGITPGYAEEPESQTVEILPFSEPPVCVNDDCASMQ